jgi:2-polyprenyl-3-methyl-5-hydroxy-6-metoxy-1,4-benzoquinol methylase
MRARWLSRRSAPNGEDSTDITNRFQSDSYWSINSRRLEHLAALKLPLFNRSVLEVGAGIGDLSRFFIDRGCTVTLTDGRTQNVEILRKRYPDLRTLQLDLDHPDDELDDRFDIVFCYGTLYHLARPADALSYLAERCDSVLLVETCVSLGAEPLLHHVEEKAEPDQALAGIGCRPTRAWVQQELNRHFEYVYLPTVQPAHQQFPKDWTDEPATPLMRAVFVASRRTLVSELLITSIPERQLPV